MCPERFFSYSLLSTLQVEWMDVIPSSWEPEKTNRLKDVRKKADDLGI